MKIKKKKNKINNRYKKGMPKMRDSRKEGSFPLKRNYKRHLEIHLVHHCNLNCAGCSHFSPSADTWFCDIETYKKDISRLDEIGVLGEFSYIHLMGGEPMLHDDVNEFMSWTRKHFKKKEIKLSTNGILLPFNDAAEKKSNFWKTARENKVLVHLSYYPPLSSKNLNNIKEMARKTKVKLRVKNKPEMRGPGFHLEGGFDPVENFVACPISVCANLLDGELYTCAPLAYAFIFNKKFHQNLPTAGGIDIYSTDPGEIMNKINKPVKLCGFCIITPEQYTKRLPWYQSGGKMEEYVRPGSDSFIEEPPEEIAQKKRLIKK